MAQRDASRHMASGGEELAALGVTFGEPGSIGQQSDSDEMRPARFAHQRLVLREVMGGEVSCMRRQESVCGLSGASMDGSRVMFSGCCGHRRVRNGFMTMLVPVSLTAFADSSATPLAVVSKYSPVPPWRASKSFSIVRASR